MNVSWPLEMSLILNSDYSTNDVRVELRDQASVLVDVVLNIN